jgi:hypothetical protein
MPKIELQDPSTLPGEFKRLGGSMSDEWNLILAGQVVSALWVKNSDVEEASKQRNAAAAALIGIAPRDELEGMLAAQLIACHNAAMECYRRAMLGEQTFDGRQESLNQANKLSRTHACLVEALNRHRGKGQQKVTVEHVHVHAGGQAVVGVMQTPGGGERRKSEGQPHALAYAPSAPLPSADPTRDRVPIPSDAKRSMLDARRPFPRGTEG